jgi:hypothetical protein
VAGVLAVAAGPFHVAEVSTAAPNADNARREWREVLITDSSFVPTEHYAVRLAS